MSVWFQLFWDKKNEINALKEQIQVLQASCESKNFVIGTLEKQLEKEKSIRKTENEYDRDAFKKISVEKQELQDHMYKQRNAIEGYEEREQQLDLDIDILKRGINIAQIELLSEKNNASLLSEKIKKLTKDLEMNNLLLIERIEQFLQSLKDEVAVEPQPKKSKKHTMPRKAPKPKKEAPVVPDGWMTRHQFCNKFGFIQPTSIRVLQRENPDLFAQHSIFIPKTAKGGKGKVLFDPRIICHLIMKSPKQQITRNRMNWAAQASEEVASLVEASLFMKI
jgi:hypothetical protein